MSNAIFQVPIAVNEPVRQYPPSAKETKSLLSTYEKMLNGAPIDMPMYIGGEEIRTDNKKRWKFRS